MSYNTPVYHAQGGTTLHVASGGTLNITGVFLLGGTQLKSAYGTATISSGVGTIATGLTTLVGFVATAIGANIGAGTFSGLQYDPSLSSSGSAIVRGLTGSLAYSANGTFSWIAFGV